MKTEPVPANADQVVEKVRERYGSIARGEASGCGASSSSCCGSVEAEVSQSMGYADKDLNSIPEEANLGLGCGAPIRHLNLRPGEVLLDLGSGGGLDAFLGLREVGPEGRVIGVDMTPEMIERATVSAERTGDDNIEFRLGRLEALPVEDASVDAVTSNCVINLVPNKGVVFNEIARVLKPGGRVVVSDIILDGKLPAAVEQDLLAYVGCVSGAMQRETYFGIVEAAGLSRPEILKDIDYLAAVGEAMPDEAAELMRRTGVRIEDLAGVVRSVTFRAVRP